VWVSESASGLGDGGPDEDADDEGSLAGMSRESVLRSEAVRSCCCAKSCGASISTDIVIDSYVGVDRLFFE